MKFYKNSDGEVFSFEDADAAEWAGPELKKMTASEISKHLNPKPVELTRDQVNDLRQIAYANPLTGSDRMFSEAMRMQIMGEDGFEEIRTKAIARFEEIQAAYPWPVD